MFPTFVLGSVVRSHKRSTDTSHFACFTGLLHLDSCCYFVWGDQCLGVAYNSKHIQCKCETPKTGLAVDGTEVNARTSFILFTNTYMTINSPAGLTFFWEVMDIHKVN